MFETSRQKPWTRLLPGFGAVLLGICLEQGAWGEQPPAQPATIVQTSPKALAPFRLDDADGRPFDLARLRGKWTFMYFGYTHCPDVCPTTLAALARVHQQLAAAAGGAANVQFVFVSLDPWRDKPPLLKRYVRYFDPSFIAATGDTHVIDHLTAELKVPYAIEDGAGDDDYVVNHSDAVLLIDPATRYFARFTNLDDIQKIARDFRQLRDHHNKL